RAELVLVEVVVLADVEIAHLLVLRLLGRHGIQRAPREELHLHVAGVAPERQEPSLVTLHPIEGLVPPHALAEPWHGVDDEPVQAPTEILLPARHGADVVADRAISVALGNLRVASGQQLGLGGLLAVSHDLLLRAADGHSTVTPSRDRRSRLSAAPARSGARCR